MGKVIISELFLPYTKKTIKPVSIGGFIGGEKYIVHGVLFKFATGKPGTIRPPSLLLLPLIVYFSTLAARATLILLVPPVLPETDMWSTCMEFYSH